MLCDAFCPHTALPRVKGMHQPRDSAIFFSTKQTPQRHCATSARAYSKRVQTVSGGETPNTTNMACVMGMS